MEELYLSGFVQDNKLYLPAASAVTLFIHEYVKTKSFQLHLVSTVNDLATCQVVLPDSSFYRTSILSTEHCPYVINNCTLPAVKCYHSNTILSGLCVVLRYILKTSARQENVPELLQFLGHKQICLKACAEVSLWTKFCEIDMPKAVDRILTKSSEGAGEIRMPIELVKLERQFHERCVIANRNKYIRKAHKPDNLESKVDGKKLDEDLSALKHNFVEGPDITLADLALIPCVALILNKWKGSISQVGEYLPLTLQWVDRLFSLSSIDAAFTSLQLPKPLYPTKDGQLVETKKITLPDVSDETQAVRQSKMKKFKVNPAELRNILQKISMASLEEQLLYDVQLNWKEFPEAVHPKDGDLPKDRLDRKCQQLDNIATAVMAIAKPGDTVIDFCAGGGHLGILLAYLLPDCKVILVENKEQSIQRAETRIEKLNLKNIILYQEYITLCHGADQTQFNIPAADQGKLCMSYIDMDRAHLAMEYGYTVILTTLKPPECSPKNNLLIGKTPKYYQSSNDNE